MLVWASERFSNIYSLGGSTLARSRRGLDLLDHTVGRYMLVFVLVMGFSVLMAMVLTFLPSWYAPDAGSGLPVPVESDGVLSSVYLLFWIVMLALVGRWAVLHFMDTPLGRRTMDRFKERMVLRRGNASRGGPRSEGDQVERVPWEEETPPPEVPLPQA